MGNYNSTPDLTNTDNIINNNNIFKVDNINSYGRKHSSAKIQVSDDSLCIHQKHRQSLFIPLDTIKRYGLDDSIFILECGRRAPLGPARYAFRCKQAQSLVDCLDQRINMISTELSDQQQQQDTSLLSLTNVSSTMNNLGRIQSAMSLSSATSFYRNSEPDLSENYFAFTRDNNDQYSHDIEVNYTDFKKSNSSVETPATIETQKSNNASGVAAAATAASTARSYVYIDHEKTTTLKEITKDRLQQHPRRTEA
ncbi:hypothetical protein I4U23_024208 [Adineta vaga]|nr:hypothetical protein I4U23_024208 [Adineta vaga]